VTYSSAEQLNTRPHYLNCDEMAELFGVGVLDVADALASTGRRAWNSNGLPNGYGRSVVKMVAEIIGREYGYPGDGQIRIVNVGHLYSATRVDKPPTWSKRCQRLGVLAP